MTLKQFKRKYLAEGMRLGYKKFLKEMAFSPSFNKDNHYSDLETKHNKSLTDYEDEYNKKREQLLKNLENEYNANRRREKNHYGEKIAISKILEKIAEAIPVEIGDMKTEWGTTGELLIDDENCPVSKILVKESNGLIQFRFIDFKKHMLASAGGGKLKPEYKEIADIMKKYDSYTWEAKMEPQELQQAIATISEGLTKMMSLYKGLSKGTGGASVTITVQQLKSMLKDGKRTSWEEDIFDYLEGEVNDFLNDLVKLINGEFRGNPTKAILNADNWFTVAEEAVYEEGGGDYDDGVEIIEKENRAKEAGYFDGTYVFVKKSALKLP